MDLAIPGDTAGPLKGDGRDFANPLRDPDLEDTDPPRDGDHRSRDRPRRDRPDRELHRVDRRPTTSATRRGRSRYGDLGLIENDSENDATGEGINLDVTNNYNVHADGDGVRIDYESRNSVSPFPAISGDITLQPGAGGALSITDDDRDQFPAYATYQYRPGDPLSPHRAPRRGQPDPAHHAARPPGPAEPPGPPRAAARPPGPAQPPAAAAPAQPAEPPGPARPARPAGPAGAAARTSRTCPICRTCRDEGYEEHDARPNRHRRGARGRPRRLRRKRRRHRRSARPRRRRPPSRRTRPRAASPPVRRSSTSSTTPGSGWPRDGYRDGAFVLPARGSAARLAPKRIEGDPRHAVRGDRPAGPWRAAGLLCRASSDGGTGYALLLDSRSTVQLLSSRTAGSRWSSGTS